MTMLGDPPGRPYEFQSKGVCRGQVAKTETYAGG